MNLLRYLPLVALLVVPAFAAESGLTVPPHAARRLATIQVRVAPDRAGWTYAVGEPVKFKIDVTGDNETLVGTTVNYSVGPEMLPAKEVTASVPAGGLVIDGGTMREPGFLRCIVRCVVDGRTYRGLATAGFAPEAIKPTQENPADFEAFWTAQKAALAKVPMDARMTLQPELCTATVDTYHVSFQNVGNGQRPTRIYGMLCVPKGPGPFPAVLRVPGAGVRPYTGARDLADRGVISLEIGIHGIPVNQPAEVYEQLGAAALEGYPVFNLDDRERYYYRRVYLGCIRANDFLTSLPKYDGKTLGVNGGSQGGQLSIVTAALDPRVKVLACNYPAYSDVTGYLHGRAGGWPHMMRNAYDGSRSPHATPAKLTTTQYYDTVNFARRLTVPGYYSWGYNDEVCPPTSLYAVYNSVTAPKQVVLALELGHTTGPEQADAQRRWLLAQLGVKE